jgi:zinc transport system permease protein
MSSAADLSWVRFVEALPDVYLAPIVTGAAAGAVLGFLGVYVVLRRLVFISAALSQVSGLGVALAFYLQIHLGLHGGLGEPVLVALALSLATTLLFQPDPARLHLSRDALLGLVYVLAGGAALFLGTRISQEAHDITSILFGVGVAVRDVDLRLTLGVGGAILAAQVWLVRGLAVATFDPVSARVNGVPVASLDIFLFFSLAVAVAITTRALGALPVFGLSVLPAIAALALRRRLGPVLVVASLVGGLAGVLGYVYAFFTRFPVGASQTVIAGLIALLAIALRAVRAPGSSARLRAGAGLGASLAVLLAAWPLFPGASAEATLRAHAQSHHPTGVTRLSGDELRALLERCDDATRCAQAAHEAGHVGDPGLRPALLALLGHADWGVRAEACEALGKLGGAEVAIALGRVLVADDNPWVRSTAADAVAQLHAPGSEKILRAALATEKDDDVRTALQTALQHLAEPHGG